jgi:aminopeptidase N
MRRLCAAALTLLVLVPILVQAQPPELMNRPRHVERSRDYDALHYRLTFVFDDAASSYTAENTVTLASLKDGLSSCAFDAEDFSVTEVVGPAGDPLAYSLTAGQVLVTLPKPLAYGEKASLTIRFSQSRPKSGLKFIAATADHPAQINTYSWPELSRHWFPCFDSPNDKASSEVIATVRSGWKVLSNGKLVGVQEDQAAGTSTWHWLQNEPHPTYCVMLAAGPFEIVRDSLGALPVEYWVYAKDVPDAPRSFRKTPRMIDFYEKTFSVPYPWAKYDQICVAGSGGGMEATTATILGQSTIHDERADQDFPSDGLVAHELAHMWWGDFVTERAWADVWLSESFATYAEYLWTRHDRGENEGALDLEEKKSSYLEEARTSYIRPIVFDRFNNPWDVMDGHSYPKGAAVLHMLRFVLGDEPFFRSLAAFLKKFAYASVDTHDFTTVVKDTTGQNLDWFFDEWLLKPGHPIFQVAWTWDDASRKVRLEVHQVQDASRNVPTFRMPVSIAIHGGAGLDVRTVWLEKGDETFEFAAAGKPAAVEFDHGHNLLMELRCDRSAEELLFALERFDAVGRIEAARELGHHLEQPGVRPALERAAEADGFWAVRAAAIDGLAAVASSEESKFLTARLSDPVSRVRAGVVQALGQRGDRGLSGSLKSRFSKETSYLVQAAILAAVGQCGGPGDRPFLASAARLRSPYGLLKRSAEAALIKIEEKSRKK